MPRRTKVQRQTARRFVEEALVRGVAASHLVRALGEHFALSPRQARYDVAQVQQAWRVEDDVLRRNRRKLIDLAIGCDRREAEIRQAFEEDDPHRALKAEQDRCKLLGLYESDRRHVEHMPLVERDAITAAMESDLRQMDPAERLAIAPPAPRSPTARRQARLDRMRAMLAAGIRGDRLEALAAAEFRLSARQIRADMRTLEEQLRYDGDRLHQGTHDLQLLPLALRRRERVALLAAQRGDAKLAAACERDRCKLLGLYAVQRPNPADDDLLIERWTGPQPGSPDWPMPRSFEELNFEESPSDEQPSNAA